MLVSLNTLWCQDSLVVVNNTTYSASMFRRNVPGIYISFGSIKNKSYNNRIDPYLNQYYDHFYVNPENSYNTVNYRHSVSTSMRTIDIGLEIPVYQRLKFDTHLSIYSISHILIEEHRGYIAFFGSVSYTARDKNIDRILIPSIGLKYYAIDIPGLAIFAESDIGYSIAKPSQDGFEAVDYERFDFKANGLKYGIATGLDFGARGFSICGSIGYVYLPIKFDNYYLQSKENFGGLKLSFALMTHF
jgi:hypothetical protein